MTNQIAAFAKPVGEKKCACVLFHNPAPAGLEAHHVWPLYLQGPDVRTNMVWICPTTHTNAHKILDTFVKAKMVLKRVKGQQPYAYKLAVRGYTEYLNSQADPNG